MANAAIECPIVPACPSLPAEAGATKTSRFLSHCLGRSERKTARAAPAVPGGDVAGADGLGESCPWAGGPVGSSGDSVATRRTTAAQVRQSPAQPGEGAHRHPTGAHIGCSGPGVAHSRTPSRSILGDP